MHSRICGPVTKWTKGSCLRKKYVSFYSTAILKSYIQINVILDNACRDSRLNNCSRNAICYDEPNGYRCECSRGYIDRSPDGGLPGRICEPPQAPTPPPRKPLL